MLQTLAAVPVSPAIPVDIFAHYQPIVSVKTRAVVGVEALCRGRDAAGNLIAPQQMFAQAKAQGCTLSLDRQCRQAALSGYSAIMDVEDAPLLFLNFDTSIIDQGVVGSDYLLNAARAQGVDPRQVVIELIESRVSNLHALQSFVQTYKSYGFNIALDDMGSGHSNLSRVPLLMPDILKVDRYIMQEIHRDYCKRVVFKSMVSLARDLGALVVAEGIETEAEALCALELGADLLQGFLFTRPGTLDTGMLATTTAQIDTLAQHFTAYMLDTITALSARSAEYDLLVDVIRQHLASVPVEALDTALRALVVRYPALDCLYILDDTGRQMTETVCNCLTSMPIPKLFYRPARRRTDHSLKEYFYLLQYTSIPRYKTEPYISLASGQRCITISVPMRLQNGHAGILCVDVKPD